MAGGERRRGSASGRADWDRAGRAARDVDEAAQALFAAALTAEALPELLARDPPEGRRLLRELIGLSRTARDAVHAFRATAGSCPWTAPGCGGERATTPPDT
jgi:Histidine kinase